MKKKMIVRMLTILAVGIVIVAAAGISFVYLAPETATRTFFSIERQRAGLVRKEIELPDGLHYVYLEGGTGEPLMLLHGFGANKDAFDRVARYLTSHYRVIVPDHIGFGESAHPTNADYSPAAQAQRLHSFATALGITSLDLGGNSMGGQIALSYGALYPSEVKTLWLLDPAGVWSAPESEMRTVIKETGQNPLLIRNEEDFAQLLTYVTVKAPFVPRPIINVMAQERIRNYELERRIFDQITGDSLEDRVKGLTIPTLIVWGDRDRLINVETADVLQKLMPRSQVIIMPNIGHVPMIERPQQTADDYMKFRSSR